MTNFKLSKQKLLDMYKQMVLIRYFEEEVERNLKRGYLHGTTHLYNGQEAIAVGVCSQLKKGDQITSTHRGHGHSIALGASINKMMAELLGRETGYSKGKGGSMHIADIDDGNLGSNGIVGGGIPIAVGAALTAQMKRLDRVVVSFFGDGATNEGSFHEALNLASIWQLPVVFVCENNIYGMSSRISDMTNIENLSERAKSYGFPGITIDGNNVYEVVEASNEAVQRARNEGGPTLIEAKTYRYKGHSRSDREQYRTKEEVNHFQKQDPIIRFEHSLLKQKLLSSKTIEQIKNDLLKQVKQSTSFALNSREPEISELTTDVYAPY